MIFLSEIICSLPPNSAKPVWDLGKNSIILKES